MMANPWLTVMRVHLCIHSMHALRVLVTHFVLHPLHKYHFTTTAGSVLLPCCHFAIPPHALFSCLLHCTYLSPLLSALLPPHISSSAHHRLSAIRSFSLCQPHIHLLSTPFCSSVLASLLYSLFIPLRSVLPLSSPLSTQSLSHRHHSFCTEITPPHWTCNRQPIRI